MKQPFEKLLRNIGGRIILLITEPSLEGKDLRETSPRTKELFTKNKATLAT